MLKVDEFPDELKKDAELINATIAALRQRRKSSVSAKTVPPTPMPVHLLEAYSQSLIYRGVALAEGACEMWNGGNTLAAVILARSVVETSVIAWELFDQVNSAISAGDVQRLQAAVHKLSSATRMHDWAPEMVPSVNILTLIDKFDKKVFAPNDLKGQVRQVYDFLSEFAHPNWAGAGLGGLYSELDHEERQVQFSSAAPKKELLLEQVIASVGNIQVIDHFLSKVDDLLPKAWCLCESSAGDNTPKC